VTLLTSFDSAYPIKTTQSYDRQTKTRTNILCPNAVFTYNEFMGGVDLLDSLVTLYQIKRRSKKYYHRLFFHFLDMAVVTCWLRYRRDCEDMGLTNKKQLSLLKFKYKIAEALCREEKTTLATSRKGRRSASLDKAFHAKKARAHASKAIPQQAVRNDNVDHFPIYKEKRGRCKLPGCNSRPYFFLQQMSSPPVHSQKQKLLSDFSENMKSKVGLCVCV